MIAGARLTAAGAMPQDICTHLQNSWREHRWLHVLVDRYDDPALHDEVEAVAAAERPAWWPLKDAMFREAPERSPALLALDYHRAAHGALLEHSVSLAWQQVQRGDARSLCAWIFSASDAQTLASAMSRRLDVLYPNARRIYLRYFDPRVMPRLAQIVGDHAAPSQLLVPVQTWCQYGRDGEWLELSAPPGVAGTAVRPDAKQAQAIDRIALINQVAHHLARQGSVLPHSADAEIDRALVHAQTLGLTEDDDLVACAVHAWPHGLQALANPEFLTCIERARDTGLPLATILAAGQATQPG